jgi:serine/threonine protein kinase
MKTAKVLNPGETLGGFRINEVIGMGGMAVVYRAEQLSLGRSVALKVLASRLYRDPEFRARFRREGLHAAGLEHDNIVPIYDSGEAEGHLYLAMRLIDGWSLSDLILEQGLTAEETIAVLRPIAGALDAAHAFGLIHRDVKPQNILVARNGQPYLADFGVAKMLSGESFTATGGFVGSANFASPEQVKNEPLSPASDVYALTAVLFQCLTSAVPYPRDSEASVLEAHISEPPPRFPDGASSEFHGLLARGMAKRPSERFGSAGELLAAASSCVDAMPGFMLRRVPAFPAKGDGKTRTETIIMPREPQTKGPGGHRSMAYRSPLNDTPTVVSKVSRRAHVRRHPPVVAMTLVGLLVLGAVAWLVLGDRSDSSFGATLHSGPAAIQRSASWRQSDFRLEGLEMNSPVAATVGGTQIVFGTIAHPVPAAGGIPTSLQGAYGKPSSSGILQLPLGIAKQYTWSGRRLAPLRVVVIATSKGEVAIACSAASLAEASQMSVACGQVLERTRIEGAAVEYPGPDPSIQRQLTSEIEGRDVVLTSISSGLASSSLTTRAEALSELARTDSRLVRELPAIAGDTRYRTALSAIAAALKREATAATEAAKAARGNKRSAYETARSANDKSKLGTAPHGLGLEIPPLHGLVIPAFPATTETATGEDEKAVTTTSPTDTSTGPEPPPTKTGTTTSEPPPKTSTSPLPEPKKPKPLSQT